MKRLFSDPLFNTIDSVFENVTNVVSKPKTVLDNVDNGYKLMLSVPGLTKDDLKIVIKDRKLTISYEKDKTNTEFNFVESFTRTYLLSNDILENKIVAEVKNGILTILLPTTDVESKEKVIKID